MQISSISTGYGAQALQALQRLLQPDPTSTGGQTLPGGQDATSDAGTAAGPPPSGGASAQFAGATLTSLLSLQQSPPTSTDIANQVIQGADGDGDGALSLAEVEQAVNGGAASTDGNSRIAAAFAKLDANGDGQLSADELASAIDAAKTTQAAHHHHGHHRHGAGSATDMAQAMLGQADSNGDGALSLDEVTQALGGSGSSGDATSLATAFGKLDANGDGQISADELTAAITAFRQSQESAWSNAASSLGAASQAPA